jgi:hypothetical protein
LADFLDYFPVDLTEDNFLILKGRIKAVETNTYGLFIMFFDENRRSIDKLSVVASHYSSLFDMDPKSPWYLLEENLLDLKWKGDIAVNVSIDLQNYMENALAQDRGSELFNYAKSRDLTKIETLLQAVLMKPLGDRNIVIDVDSEIISKESTRAVRAERDRSKNPDGNRKKTQSAPDVHIKGADIVDVDLVLAPVSGIPINELTIGDTIMVKISPKSTLGNYYIDSFGARVDGSIIPVAAEVVDINRGDDREYILFCKLGENVYGKVIETEQVRVKRHDELLLAQVPTGEGSHPFFKRKRPFTFFIIITGGLIFALLFISLLLWLNNLL